MNPFDSIVWDCDGGAIESESFRRIDAEADPRMRGRFSDAEWRVARRLVHTTADFSILPELEFSGGAVEAELPEGCCQISGDNMGGFIVTAWEALS